MRRKICSLALAFVLAAGMTVPAGAAPTYTTDPAQIKSYIAGTDMYVQDGYLYRKNDAFTDKWLAEHPNFLDDHFKTEKSRAWIEQGFSEGLARIEVQYGPPSPGLGRYHSYFVNVNGEILDFEPTRYDEYGDEISWYYNKTHIPATQFKEGLAYAEWGAIEHRHVGELNDYGEYCYRVGFVDKTGTCVLDISQYPGRFWFYAGEMQDNEMRKNIFRLYPRFVNGYTIVSPGPEVALGTGIISVLWSEYDDPTVNREPQGANDFNTPLDEQNLPRGQKSVFYVIDRNGKVVETIPGYDALMRHPLTQVALVTDGGVPYGYLMALLAGSTPNAGGANEQPVVEPAGPATYGQSAAKAKGYTIENNIGYLLVDVTNGTKNIDEGDLFYILYQKYLEEKDFINSTTEFLPAGSIRKIHYKAQPNATTTLRIPVDTVLLDGELTDENKAAGWMYQTNVADSRILLAQAETQEECDELTEYFKGAHFYGEIELDYAENENGVTRLAETASTTGMKKYLDVKLSALTSQF